MKEEIITLLQFLKKPSLGFDNKERLKKFITILSIDIIITLIVISIFIIIDKIDIIKNILIYQKDDLGVSVLILILSIIIIPIIEEIIFRYFLVYKRYNPLRIFIKNKTKDNNEISYKGEEHSDENWNRILPIIFYISALLFSLFHLFIYEINTIFISLLPLFIISQFITGLLLGYIRIKISFAAGCGLHIIHNAVLISIALFASGECNSMDNEDLLLGTKKKNIEKQELSMTAPEYDLYISIDDSIGSRYFSTLEFEEETWCATKYEIENYLLKDLYRDTKTYYKDSMLLTNPDFLEKYDQDLRVNIMFTKKDSCKIYSLDTVMKFMKAMLESIK